MGMGSVTPKAPNPSVVTPTSGMMGSAANGPGMMGSAAGNTYQTHPYNPAPSYAGGFLGGPPQTAPLPTSGQYVNAPNVGNTYGGQPYQPPPNFAGSSLGPSQSVPIRSNGAANWMGNAAPSQPSYAGGPFGRRGMMPFPNSQMTPSTASPVRSMLSRALMNPGWY